MLQTPVVPVTQDRPSSSLHDFTHGAYSPCVLKHKTKRIWYLVHEDDYVGVGAEPDLEWYRPTADQQEIHHQTSWLL